MFDFLYTAVSWVLLRWHQLFTAIGLDPKGGVNWTLSIIFLVVTARLLLFRLFVKQVHYQRHMQEMQPKMQELAEKHKGDRADAQGQEGYGKFAQALRGKGLKVQAINLLKTSRIPDKLIVLVIAARELVPLEGSATSVDADPANGGTVLDLPEHHFSRGHPPGH